jgi:hypothetical protein
MKILIAILALAPSLAWADCVQLNTGVIDCDGTQGYPLGNSDHVYVPGAGFETIQPPSQWPTPKYLQPENFDNPHRDPDEN